MNQEDINKALYKFVSDPEWHYIEDALKDYIAPLHDIEGVDTSQDSDAVRAEVIARKLAAQRLEQFLSGMNMVKSKFNRPKTSFR